MKLNSDEKPQGNFHLVGEHTIYLLREGREYFPRLVAAIDGSTQAVYLESYIFACDDSGKLISAALQRAAQRGVRTHLLVDGFGSADFSSVWVNKLRSAGVEVLIFRPEISWLSLRRKRLRRLHRKLAAVDGRIAFVGGINIIDDVPGGEITQPRLDYAVEVQGPTAAVVHSAMRRLWTQVAWMNLRRHRKQESFKPQVVGTRQKNLVFLVRDNLRHRRDIEHAYLNAIKAAQHEIIIANAYFLPGRRFRLALKFAAQRGVKVILLLQGKVEYWLQHYATLALYDELLGSGLEIHEYHASYLHAKVAVIDGHWATVGSSNIEPLSLWLAREANLVVFDREFAGTLRASLMQQMTKGALKLENATWDKRSVWMRLLIRLSYNGVRLLTGLLDIAHGQDDV
jgi:cardiolipin synthase